jgi:hypothetical protein
MIKPGTYLTYLRHGRQVRAMGSVVDMRDGLTKVKPLRADWGAVWLTTEEIAAGAHKPPMVPRKAPETKTPRTRKPKPTPLPRWKQLVERVRAFETDHHPEGWPCVQMKFLSELADELEAAQTLFQPIP